MRISSKGLEVSKGHPVAQSREYWHALEVGLHPQTFNIAKGHPVAHPSKGRAILSNPGNIQEKNCLHVKTRDKSLSTLQCKGKFE